MNAMWPLVAVLGIVLIADLKTVPLPSQQTTIIPRQRTAPIHYVCSKPDTRSAVIVLTPIEEGAKPLSFSCVNCECSVAK